MQHLIQEDLAGLDQLFARAQQEQSVAERLREIHSVLTRLPMLGPYNAMLADIQRPGAQFVARRDVWASQFHRQVRPHATPIVVLKPFGPVDFVFDVRDTDGAPLPPAVTDPYRVAGEVSRGGVEELTRRLAARGIRCETGHHGSEMTGIVRRIDPEATVARLGSAASPQFEIVLNSTLDPAATLATIFHGFGHVYCHHLHAGPGRSPRRQPAPGRRSREFEAETVAWLLCARLGIPSPAGEFLAGYEDEDGSVPAISPEAVVTAAGRVEALAGGLQGLAAMVSSASSSTLPAAGAQLGPSQDQGVLDLGL